MQSTRELIDLIRNYVHDNQSNLTQFFCCSTPLKTELAKLIQALNEFDDVKYVPDNIEDKRREKALLKIKQCINACENLMPKKDEGLLTTISTSITDHLAYYSEGIRYHYWTGPDQPLSDKPPGIAIAYNDPRPKRNQVAPYSPDFENLVVTNLNYIWQTPSGKHLLQTLVAFTQQQYNLAPTDMEKINILPTAITMGNYISHQSPKQVLHSVAKEFISSTINFPKDTMAALTTAQAKLGFKDIYQWLADKINESPEFKFAGSLSDKPFLHQDKQISAELIKTWLSRKGNDGNDFIFKNFPREISSHIINATIAALTDYSIPNVGSGSYVRWNPSPEYATNQKRPPAIGLAHELIHAYYNAKGMQPGAQETDETTVLFEYLTVGLGLWASNKPSENSIRKEWNNALAFIPAEDKLNHKSVEQREFYALEDQEEVRDEVKLDSVGLK